PPTAVVAHPSLATYRDRMQQLHPPACAPARHRLTRADCRSRQKMADQNATPGHPSSYGCSLWLTDGQVPATAPGPCTSTKRAKKSKDATPADRHSRHPDLDRSNP